MPVRLLLIWLMMLAPLLRAQAPGTVRRGDIDGRYQRPDLGAPLFNAEECGLNAEQTDALLRALVIIARNFPDSAEVSHRLRARALAVALRLKPDDRAAVVANGQLARGITPAPLSGVAEPTPEGVARTLFDLAAPLSQAEENEGRQLGGLLLDLAVSLDSRLRRKVSVLTYLVKPDWRETKTAGAVLEAPRTFQLQSATARVIVPGPPGGALQWLTVQAKAMPAEDRKGLRVTLPPALLQAMSAKNGADLRTRVEQRMTALRTALRARHVSWPEGWSVEFEASGGPPDGLPALFAGMALTLDALLSGEPLDDRYVLAAGMDATGLLHPVMPAGDLLTAAAQSTPAPVLILPARSAEEVTDWLLLNPEAWPVLAGVTLHQSVDLNGAMVLSRQMRAPRLTQALASFDEVAVRIKLANDPLIELRKPENVARLREVVTWHAGHLSAAALLRVAEPGTAVLSVRGSLARIDVIARGILSTDRKKYPLHGVRGPLAKSVFFTAGEELLANVKMLHPDVRGYAAEVVALGKMLDRACGHWNAYLKDNGPADPPEISARRRQAISVRAELEAR